MTHSPAEQHGLAVRSRTNAALVFGFHCDLRRVPTKSDPSAKPAHSRVLERLSEDAGGPSTSLGLAAQIAKWIAMVAAIAAPWVLLLTG
jgi:hypothetical protein